MYPFVVVLPDGAVDVANELAQGIKPVRVPEIDFELVVEGFLVAVLPRTAGLAPRDRNAALFEQVHERFRLILLAIVRMEDDRLRMVEEGVRKRLHAERRSFPYCHMEADDLSREEIEDGRDIHLPAMEDEFREIRRPDVVRVRWHHFEKQVRICPFHLAFPVFLAMPAVWLDAEETHHPSHTLPVHAKRLGQPPGTIRWPLA